MPSSHLLCASTTCSPLHLFFVNRLASASRTCPLTLAISIAWKVRFSCFENLLRQAELLTCMSFSGKSTCTAATTIGLAWAAGAMMLYFFCLTVLVQDLCYSDPLSSVLTISDPNQVRDELSLHCSSLSLCMSRHASMSNSCNKTDRTTIWPLPKIEGHDAVGAMVKRTCKYRWGWKCTCRWLIHSVALVLNVAPHSSKHPCGRGNSAISDA